MPHENFLYISEVVLKCICFLVSIIARLRCKSGQSNSRKLNEIVHSSGSESVESASLFPNCLSRPPVIICRLNWHDKHLFVAFCWSWSLFQNRDSTYQLFYLPRFHPGEGWGIGKHIIMIVVYFQLEVLMFMQSYQ